MIHILKRKLLLLLATFFIGTGLVFAGTVLLGDANGDGSVTIADVTAVVLHLHGSTPENFNATAANANRDAVIDIADVTAISNIIHYNTPTPNSTSSILFFTVEHFNKTYGDAAFSNTIVRAGSTGDITYESSAPGVATVDESTGEVTIVGAGTTTITATLAANGNFASTTATFTVTVAKAPSTTEPSSTMTTAVEPVMNGDDNQTYTGSPLPLVNAGESSAGPLKYKVTTTEVAPSKDAEGWSSEVPTATGAGTYYVWYYAEGNDNYNETAVSGTPISVTIDKAASTTDPSTTMTTPVAAKKDGDNNQTYTGSALELVTGGVSSAGTVYYKMTPTNEAPSKDAEGWSTDVPTATDAGTYYVWYYAGGNDNYETTVVSATPITVTIDKAAGTTDPASTMTTSVEAKKIGEANQSYTGSALELVTAGESSAGELKYQVTTTNTQPTKDEGTWTTTVPTATDAGTYYVWYYAEGNVNYNETAVSAAPITVTLDKIPFSHPDFVIADVASQTYTGSAITPTPGVTLGGVAIAAGEKTFTYSYEANTDAGTAKVILTPAADGNISGDPREVSFTIAPAAVTITAETTQSVTYNGNPQPLTASVSAGTLLITYYTDNERTEGETTTAPTNAGTYYARVIQTNPNYDPDATDIVYTINKKTVTVSGITAANKTYDGTDVATLDCSSPTFDGIITGDILTITATGHFTEVNVGTDKDVALVDLTLGGTSVDNYQLAATGNQDIAKANITAAAITPVATISGWTYGGEAQSPIVTGNTGSGLETPYYKSGESDWTTTLPTNAGTYQVKVHVAASGNYAEAETAPVDFTIAKATMTGITVTAYNAAYDGVAHGITVNNVPEGATVTYSTDGENYQAANYTYTNVTAAQTVYFKVSKTNYNDFTSSSTVTISQKALTITANAQSISYGSPIATGVGQVTASGLVAGDDLTAVTLTASTSDVTTTGTITPSAATTTKGISNYAVTYNTGNLTISNGGVPLSQSQVGYFVCSDGLAYSPDLIACNIQEPDEYASDEVWEAYEAECEAFWNAINAKYTIVGMVAYKDDGDHGLVMCAHDGPTTHSIDYVRSWSSSTPLCEGHTWRCGTHEEYMNMGWGPEEEVYDLGPLENLLDAAGCDGFDDAVYWTTSHKGGEFIWTYYIEFQEEEGTSGYWPDDAGGSVFRPCFSF